MQLSKSLTHCVTSSKSLVSLLPFLPHRRKKIVPSRYSQHLPVLGLFERGGVEKPLPTHNHRACLKFSLHFLSLALLFLISSSPFPITLCSLDSVSPLCPPKQCQNCLSPVFVLFCFSRCWGWKMRKDPSRKWFPIPEVDTQQVLEGVVLLVHLYF